MKKLFAFDIDGTLLVEGKDIISKKTKEAINLIKKNGDIPILSTGRSYSQSLEIVKQLELDTYLISSAGVMLTNLKKNSSEILSKVPISIINYFFELCSKNKRQFNIKLKDGAVKYYFGSDPKKDIDENSLFWKKGGTLNPKYNKISNFYNDVNLEEVLQVSMKAEPELINKLYEKVKNDVNKLDSNFTVIIVSDVYLELADKKWNKATAIDKVRKIENIDKENVYVFGDSNNDIEMMKMFKNSIAMGNSTNEILSIASKVIGNCEDDGVADFISKFYNTEIVLNNKTLFAFDLDGTLIQDNEIISDKTIEAIKMIKENGDIPIIATGRSFSRTQNAIKKLGIDTYVINCSGGSTFDFKKNNHIMNTKIPKEITDYFIYLAKREKRLLIIKFSNSELRYYFGDDVYKDIPKNNLFWIRGDLSSNSLMDVKNIENDLDYNSVIHLAIKAEPDVINKIFEQSREEVSKINNNFSTQIVSDVFLDLKNINCNKSTAINSVRETENIDINNVYVFGDSSNDIEMISFFKNGIAMGNATEDVKKVASQVIGNCDDNGVYDFIKGYYDTRK